MERGKKAFLFQEVLRRDWMFKLVGTETFTVGKNKAACSIKIEPVGGFSYEYSLEVSLTPSYYASTIPLRSKDGHARWQENRTRSSLRTRTKS